MSSSKNIISSGFLFPSQHRCSCNIAPELEHVDPCNPSPCGPNAVCSNGICSCSPNNYGDPYQGCRPECIINSECSQNLACIQNKCKDPCVGTCGSGADCNVYNHIPICSCPSDWTGNPFIQCQLAPSKYSYYSAEKKNTYLLIFFKRPAFEY